MCCEAWQQVAIVAMCCSVLQRVTVCVNGSNANSTVFVSGLVSVLQCVTVCYNAWQYVAVCCSVMQRVAAGVKPTALSSSRVW